MESPGRASRGPRLRVGRRWDSGRSLRGRAGGWLGSLSLHAVGLLAVGLAVGIERTSPRGAKRAVIHVRAFRPAPRVAPSASPEPDWRAPEPVEPPPPPREPAEVSPDPQPTPAPEWSQVSPQPDLTGPPLHRPPPPEAPPTPPPASPTTTSPPASPAEPSPAPSAPQSPTEADGPPDQPARVTQRVEPAYPRTCARRRHAGTAVVRVTVGVDGRARALEVVRSADCGDLDAAALEAAAGFRFEPARRAGRAVETVEEIAFRFTHP